MKKAWIENNVVRDVAQGNPNDIYHPEIAGFYSTEVPDDVINGARLIDGVWNNPEPVKIVFEKEWSVADVRAGLTLNERVNWDNDKTDSIKTAKIEFGGGLKKSNATNVLQLLVDSGDISAASMSKILE